jgi:hypothetical protein
LAHGPSVIDAYCCTLLWEEAMAIKSRLLILCAQAVLPRGWN